MTQMENFVNMSGQEGWRVLSGERFALPHPTDAIMMFDKRKRRSAVEHNGRDKSGPYPWGNKLPDEKVNYHNRVRWGGADIALSSYNQR